MLVTRVPMASALNPFDPHARVRPARSIFVALAALLPLASSANQPTCDFQTASLPAVRNLALHGDVCAESALGVRYATGRGVPQDYAQSGAWLSKAAAQGNAEAETMLGKVYYNGLGVSKDYRQAVAWWRKAAEQGNADAETGLGFAFDLGRGVPRDYNQSASWFRKAAERGSTAAETGLGLDYAMGRGVPRDSVLACMLIDLGVAGGNQNAMNTYHFLEQQLSATQLSEAKALAAHWKVGTPLPTAP